MREPTDEEVLSSLSEQELARLLALVPDDVEIAVPPREGLVLLTCREGLGSRFHAGEVLVSCARTTWRGVGGWSMVAGADPRRAVVGSVLDAARRAGPDGAELDPLRRMMDGFRQELAARRAEESALSAATRVEFDLMPGA